MSVNHSVTQITLSSFIQYNIRVFFDWLPFYYVYKHNLLYQSLADFYFVWCDWVSKIISSIRLIGISLPTHTTAVMIWCQRFCTSKNSIELFHTHPQKHNLFVLSVSKKIPFNYPKMFVILIFSLLASSLHNNLQQNRRFFFLVKKVNLNAPKTYILYR